MTDDDPAVEVYLARELEIQHYGLPFYRPNTSGMRRRGEPRPCRNCQGIRGRPGVHADWCPLRRGHTAPAARCLSDEAKAGIARRTAAAAARRYAS